MNYEVTAVSIVSFINEHFKLDVQRRYRREDYIEARKIASYFIKKYTKLYLKQIAPFVGVTDHSSVIHHVAYVEDRIKNNDDFRILINVLDEGIKEKCIVSEMPVMKNRTDIQNEVCSPFMAKKLKMLGVIQKSIFYYREVVSLKVDGIKYTTEWDNPCIIFSNTNEIGCISKTIQFGAPRCCVNALEAFSAFTVGELGRLLPDDPCDKHGTLKIKKQVCTRYPYVGKYELFREGLTDDDYHYFGVYDNEAEARASLLIYLLQTKRNDISKKS